MKSGFENHTEFCFLKSDSTVPLVVMKQAKDYDFFFFVSFVAALLDYNVGNQQDATIFHLLILFKSTLHVSGDRFDHPQEHSLTVYTAFGTMQRHCC